MTTTISSMLTDHPTSVAPGIRAWRNPGNKYVGVLLSFEADPSGTSEADRREGLDEQGYQREHGLSFQTFAGKPAYPGFDETKHVGLPIYGPDLPVLRGWDFGYHHPAVVFAQLGGTWQRPVLWVLGELMGEDVTLDDFVTRFVEPYQAAVFGETAPKYLDFGDPAGRQVNDKSNFTSFAVLANHGIFVRARKSELNEGLTTIRRQLATPGGLVFHQRCRLLIQGFKGGYRYAEPTRANSNPLYPMKDGFFDHLQDAFRYLVVNNLRVRDTPDPDPPKDPDPPFWAEAMSKRTLDRSDDWD